MLELLLGSNKPQTIFLNSMSKLFHKEVQEKAGRILEAKTCDEMPAEPTARMQRRQSAPALAVVQ